MRIKLDFPITLKEVAMAVGGRVCECIENKIITYISTDSREVFKNDLFIALKGEKFDGEDFTNESIKKGAFALSTIESKQTVLTNDTNRALLDFAAYYKTKFKNLKYTVAITGSVGKTTTKEFLKALLSEKYKTHSTYKNRNNGVGVPLTVLSMPKDTEALVVELGMNHRGEISAASKCISPNLSIIINVGTSHIGNLGSRKNISEAKLEILDGMTEGTLIVPKEEPLLAGQSGVTFSSSDNTSDCFFDRSDGGALYVKGSLFSKVNFKLSEKHFGECLAAAAAAAVWAGLSSEEIKRGVSKISRENTRQKLICVDDFYVLADFYNSSIESVNAAFATLNSLSSYHRKSALIGDVNELGEYSTEIHRALGAEIAQQKLDRVYLFGKNSKYVKEGLISADFSKNKIHVNEDLDSPQLTAEQIKSHHTRGEIILIKGSRALRLERILEYFDIRDNFF